MNTFFLSVCFGCRVTYKLTVQAWGFLQGFYPRDQVMAEMGFTILDILALYQCTLATPPSKLANI